MVGSATFAWVAASAGGQLRRLPEQPTSSCASNLQVGDWVVLRDATLQCEGDYRTKALKRAVVGLQDGKPFVLGRFSVECRSDTGAIAGVVRPLLERDARELERQGFPRSVVGLGIWVCADCGPADERFNLARSLFFVL